MVEKSTIRRAIWVSVCFLFTLTIPCQSAENTETYDLDNGLTVILKENHASPMVASIIFIKSGSKYESDYENGITHFLEHLLFDGTANLTREELDHSIRRLGGYINAFTRKEMTAYFVLMPKHYIDYGLTVQADMLFNSVFPEQELAKERQVVIEEINQSMDNPEYAAETFFSQKAYAGTDYDRTVLGYREFIENIPREAIIDYWKRYYVPGNMTALIIGDFEPMAMKHMVAATFGGAIGTSVAPDSSLTDPGNESVAEPSIRSNEFTGQAVFDTLAPVTTTHIDFSIAAPHFSDPDYLAFDLMSQYLSMDDISPLKKALTSGDSALATEVSVGLVTHEEFSRLEISVLTDKPENREVILRTVTDQLASLGNYTADPETIEGIKTSVKCDNIYYAEKLHYYGFIIAPMMMSAGWDFLQSYPERLSEIHWSQCQAVAKKWLATPDFVATVVRPMDETGTEPFRPTGLGADIIAAYFDTAQFAGLDSAAVYPLAYPQTDSVSLDLDDRAEYYREVLANGMTVIIKSSPDSRVFAMNVLGKNRTANEPENKEGITDFVNHCLEKGTVTRNARELSRDLARIGASVTLYDNPWIPYDDRYTTRRFSFLKFETIDEFAEKGFHLFSEMLLFPSFDSSEVENVRRSLMGSLGRKTAKPRDVARDLFFATMFEGSDYGRTITGTARSIGSIGIDDIREHHHRFYAPENLILTIGTNQPVAKVKSWVDRMYGRLTPAGMTYDSAAAPQMIPERRVNKYPMESEQIALYLGCPLPGAGSGEAAAIKVATSILSERLYLNLREKQGLAYSVGAGTVLDKHFGWQYSVISTAADNYQRALDGIVLQIDKLKLDGPTAEEIYSARNQLWGSLSRAKLSRINQAYYLAVDEYLGLGLGHDQEYLNALAVVTVSDIRRVMARYFMTDFYVLAAAGKVQ